jgi:hypothetical protein
VIKYWLKRLTDLFPKTHYALPVPINTRHGIATPVLKKEKNGQMEIVFILDE